METRKATERSIGPDLRQVDELRRSIEARGAMGEAARRNWLHRCKLELTTESCALEGSQLSFDDTKILLELELVIGGKPAKCYRDAVNFARAFDMMADTSQFAQLPLTAAWLDRLHRALCGREQTVRRSSPDLPADDPIGASPQRRPIPPHTDVAQKLDELLASAAEGREHALTRAALLHNELIALSPYPAQNAPLARLMLNLLLLHDGYGLCLFPRETHADYLRAVQAALSPKRPDHAPFVRFLAARLLADQAKRLA